MRRHRLSQYAPPPQQQWQSPPVPPQPSYTLPDTPRGKGLPTWLITILVAVAAVGVLFGAYKLLGNKNGAGTDSNHDGVGSIGNQDR